MLTEDLPAFSPERTVTLALDFQVALAHALADNGLASTAAAQAVERAARESPPEPASLLEAARHAGTLAIPLVAYLREKAEALPESGGTIHRGALHRGATSQDVADTVLVLQVRDGLRTIEPMLESLCGSLASLAVRHESTPMPGRTLLQPGEAITFGYKAAQWLTGVVEARSRMLREADAALVLQFGGAVGTHKGLEGKGADVARLLGRRLALPVPDAPWHSRRGNLAALAAACGVLSGALAKVATDIALLSQPGVAEVFEPRSAGRGGSSAMAWKRNPTGCQQTLTALAPIPGLVSTLLVQLPVEHERGLHGWQGDAEMFAQILSRIHAALLALTPVLAEPEIDVARMADALDGRDDVGEAVRLTRALLAACHR